MTPRREAPRTQPRISPTEPLAELDQACEDSPGSPAVTVGATTWTYADLRHGSLVIARGLRQHGVGRGHRVLLHLANSPTLLACYYACFRLGAVACPTNTRFTATELARAIGHLAPLVYIGDPRHVAVFAEVDADLAENVVRLDVHQLDPLRPSPPDITEFTPPDADDVAVLFGTSGTDGDPKFVAHTAATLAATASSVAEGIVPPTGPAMVLPPWVHAFGFFSWSAHVRHRVTVIGSERFDPEVALDEIDRHRCSLVVGLPFMFTALLVASRRPGRTPHSVQTLLVSGDAPAARLQEEVEVGWGAPLRQFWASTEIAGALTWSRRRGPISHVCRGTAFRLVDDRGCPAQGPGELWISSPAASVGYWNPVGLAVEPLSSDGWVHTGDVFESDGAAELRFLGRWRQIIVRGGSNVSPVEVEDVLRKHDGVDAVIVVGRPDEFFGEEVVAYVEPSDTATDDLVEDLEVLAQADLAEYKVPADIHLVDELPTTPMGKPDRAEVHGWTGAHP